MRLTEASIAIRPRNTWEALDLGFLTARRHSRLLILSWALVTLPVFLLLSLLLWRHPSWAFLLFWWLKPAFDRLPLLILSRALFNQTPTLKEAIKAWPKTLRPQLFASLTWRRFSPFRSFLLPVQQLEQLSGSARARRVHILVQGDSSVAGWLTIIGVAFEMVLWLGLASLVYLLLPQATDLMELDLIQLLESVSDELWLSHLLNLFYALILIVWEPIYVACGFTLYLNRRTLLEAWDIELTFRRLRQRLAGTTLLLALALTGLLSLQPGNMSWAATQVPAQAETASDNGSRASASGPLSMSAASERIAQVLDNPPFSRKQTVTQWRWKKNTEEKADKAPREKPITPPTHWGNSLSGLSQGLQILLWAVLAGLIIYVLLRYRNQLGTIAEQARQRRTAPPREMFGLEVAPETLPLDVPGEAERLWQDNPRAALGLLYRALLSHLLHERHLPLKAAHTENEVLPRIDTLDHPELIAFSHLLTWHWQALAYGHQAPAPDLLQRLSSHWRTLFGSGERR